MHSKVKSKNLELDKKKINYNGEMLTPGGSLHGDSLLIVFTQEHFYIKIRARALSTLAPSEPRADDCACTNLWRRQLQIHTHMHIHTQTLSRTISFILTEYPIPPLSKYVTDKGARGHV